MIYILTNPSFPNYQKIGKTTDLKGRLRNLNDKTCLPFSFRVYATYELEKDLSEVEEIIFNLIEVAVRRDGARFSFAKKGIPLGASIDFINYATKSAVTLEDYPPIVMFENKKWKLSPLVAELKRRDGTSTASESYQGAAYFMYNGVRLIDMPDVE